jgi:hypothetical protein
MTLTVELVTTVEDQIEATREGGAVERCHVVRHSALYDNAQHTYGALNLLLLLHPEPSLRLIKAVQWHDVPERWTGDVPATAKWMCPVLREALALIEEPIMRRFGLHQELTEEDKAWLLGVDVLELWLWCREHQDELHPQQVMNTCAHYLVVHKDTLPIKLMDVFSNLQREPLRLLPDVFPEISDRLSKVVAVGTKYLGVAHG